MTVVDRIKAAFGVEPEALLPCLKTGKPARVFTRAQVAAETHPRKDVSLRQDHGAGDPADICIACEGCDEVGCVNELVPWFHFSEEWKARGMWNERNRPRPFVVREQQ